MWFTSRWGEVTVVSLAALCLWHWLRSRGWRRNPKRLPYPPGPKAHPVIGNLLQMPAPPEWLAAAELGKTYGNLVFLDVLGTKLLFVNSYEDAHALLDKRSSIYSSRPPLPMLELMKLDWFVSLLPYNNLLRRNRHYFHRFFQRNAANQFHPIQLRSTQKLLLKLLETPEQFAHHIRRSTGATIMAITYGHDTVMDDDPYISMAERTARLLGEAMQPGTHLVNTLPWLKYVPKWFPGAGFQRVAEDAHELSNNVRYALYFETKKQFQNNTSQPSMASKLLDAKMSGQNGISLEEEDLIAGCTATAYVAGADTTVSSALTFILAMILFPDVQRRGQEEIDRVVGKDRLPTFEDRDSLPYVNAMCAEVMRWGPVAPMGAPHTLDADDEYMNYFIPAGVTVIPNVWAMLQDPVEYPNPSEFMPERYLSNGGKIDIRHPRHAFFGFGRRRCPGLHMAENSIFINVALLLATFDIGKALGKDGREITPTREFSINGVCHPKEFACSITPRSSEKEVMIRDAVADAMTDESAHANRVGSG